MAKKKKPKTVLVCGCSVVDQRDERFVKISTGKICECTERDRETGEFLKSKTGLKEVNFSSITITKSSDVLERIE